MLQFIKQELGFLVEEYDMKFESQIFTKPELPYWSSCTYSFYNDYGCFTIHTTPVVREEDYIGFYRTENFSNDEKYLVNSKNYVDIGLLEPEIWGKARKIWVFPDIFFWYKHKKIIKTIALMIKKKY